MKLRSRQYSLDERRLRSAGKFSFLRVKRLLWDILYSRALYLHRYSLRSFAFALNDFVQGIFYLWR
ncbi:hypothetical protein BLAHAN_05316 [Blautia hansenii DSM 20583]|uniref:Uncharacterized protein n=1 Tax=Blautia hansenii DSM 20583 TaxID=537007 RepID=C9L7F0_BLAHA|nr:hypothetical protein BLAHAN_05316 [Blautia hansenii DSM 20583]